MATVALLGVREEPRRLSAPSGSAGTLVRLATLILLGPEHGVPLASTDAGSGETAWPGWLNRMLGIVLLPLVDRRGADAAA
jgi:hypothetical protein